MNDRFTPAQKKVFTEKGNPKLRFTKKRLLVLKNIRRFEVYHCEKHGPSNHFYAEIDSDLSFIRGCILCGTSVRIPQWAIENLKNNLPEVDYSQPITPIAAKAKTTRKLGKKAS